MVQARCIQKFRNKSDIITAYLLEDSNGQQLKVTPEQLKMAIFSKQIDVTNLKLTQDGRLINMTSSEHFNELWNFLKKTSDGRSNKVIEKEAVQKISELISKVYDTEFEVVSSASILVLHKGNLRICVDLHYNSLRVKILGIKNMIIPIGDEKGKLIDTTMIVGARNSDSNKYKKEIEKTFIKAKKLLRKNPIDFYLVAKNIINEAVKQLNIDNNNDVSRDFYIHTSTVRNEAINEVVTEYEIEQYYHRLSINPITIRVAPYIDDTEILCTIDVSIVYEWIEVKYIDKPKEKLQEKFVITHKNYESELKMVNQYVIDGVEKAKEGIMKYVNKWSISKRKSTI